MKRVRLSIKFSLNVPLNYEFSLALTTWQGRPGYVSEKKELQTWAQLNITKKAQPFSASMHKYIQHHHHSDYSCL